MLLLANGCFILARAINKRDPVLNVAASWPSGEFVKQWPNSKIEGTLLLFLLALVLVGAWWFVYTSPADEAGIEAELQQLIVAQGVEPLTTVWVQERSEDPTAVALITLGQTLFFETELSGNRDISCATCHHPSFGLTDGLPLAVGTGGSGVGPDRILGEGRQFVPRNTPDVANRGVPERTTLFWDGRIAQTDAGFDSPAGEHLPDGLSSVLAVQALLAVTSRHEMRGGLYDVAGYLIQPGERAEDYQPGGLLGREQPLGWQDQDIFGEPNELATFGNDPAAMPLIWDALTARITGLPRYQSLLAAAYPAVPLEQIEFTHLAEALAAFQTATFTYANTPWDRYLAGETAALSLEAKQGAVLFYGAAGCASCHAGPLFSDQQTHNIGAPQVGPGRSPLAPLDYGRFEVTGAEADRFAFLTPSLRQVTMTGPWFHNGVYNDLHTAVRHHFDPATYLTQYDGSHLPPDLQATVQNAPVTTDAILSTLSPQLPLTYPVSDQEIGQLLAFLAALSAE